MREAVLVLFAVSGHLTAVTGFERFDITLVLGSLMILEMSAALFLKKIHLRAQNVAVFRALALFLGFAMVSSLLGDSKVYVWQKWLSFAAVLVGFLYCFSRGSKIKLQRIAFWHCVYCLYLASVYYTEIIGYGNLERLIWQSDSAGLSDYLTSSYYFYLALLMVLSLNYTKLLYTMFAVFAPVLAFLGARGAALFFILVLIFALFKARMRGRYFIVASIGLAAVYTTTVDSLLKYRFESALSGNDNSLSARFTFYKDAIDNFLSTPFVGIGFGSFGVTLYGQDIRMYPHNVLLEILVELGALGVFFFGNFCAKAVARVKESPFRWMLLFMTLDLMKSSTFVEPKYLWMFLGISLLADNSSGQIHRTHRTVPSSTKTFLHSNTKLFS